MENADTNIGSSKNKATLGTLGNPSSCHGQHSSRKAYQSRKLTMQKYDDEPRDGTLTPLRYLIISF